MKIAIPSNDQVTISNHFGRAAGFMIFETENDSILRKEYKQNTFTKHTHGHHHKDNPGAGHHSHTGIFNALGDCQIVIAGGMGQRLYNDFEKREIQVFVTTEKKIDKALELFINNKLDNNSDQCCSH